MTHAGAAAVSTGRRRTASVAKAALDGRLGAAGLADGYWGTLDTGPLGDVVTLRVDRITRQAPALAEMDQLGTPRPVGAKGDAGAIELPTE